MRIIAGKFRSRTLKATDHIRPTKDRVRETLFNVLQNNIEGSVFVDAFSGSGSVGIEAISRGAAMTYFIESNTKALRVLEQNLQSIGAESWRISTMDVWKALDVLAHQLPVVDIFYFDPPYEFHKYSNLLVAAGRSHPEALYIVEHSSRVQWETPEEFEQTRSLRIGETTVSFYKRVLQEQE